MSQSIVIIGAGPAGLTAAYELLKKGQVSVTILEATGGIGGISRTKNSRGTVWISAATAFFQIRQGYGFLEGDYALGGQGKESAQIRPICCF